MKTLNLITAFAALAFSNASAQQIKNAQTATVQITGNCGMCEKTIEKAGSAKGEASVDWDMDRNTATITFDSTSTDLDAILKRIAHAGYDNERYLAPQEAYDGLHGCCKYERTLKHDPIEKEEHAHDHPHSDHGSHEMKSTADQVAKDQLDPVFSSYFTLKDALVSSDQKSAAKAASDLAI